MNRLSLLLLATLWFTAMPAQKRYDAAKISSFTIRLPAPSAQTAKLSAPVLVVDKRFDTTKTGFVSDGSKSKTIQTEGSTANVLQLYLNGTGADNSETKTGFLLVLRSLWLQEMKAGELRDADEENEKQNISRCTVKFDVFTMEKGLCRALVRIDTVLETAAYLKAAGGELLADALDYALLKIAGLNAADVTAKKTPVKLDDLLQLYEKKMTIPRLESDSLLRGIYLTYDDFVQKRPTLSSFVLEQDEGGDYLYLNENGEQRLFTGFWGFCDGRFHFIKLGTNFFPLVRDGNSYSFLGCLQPVHNSQPRSRNRVGRYALFGVLGELHQTRLKKFLRPMQLDMETGRPL